MKMNAKETNFELRMDQTIKITQDKVLFEKINGQAKAKRLVLKKLSWGK